MNSQTYLIGLFHDALIFPEMIEDYKWTRRKDTIRFIVMNAK